MPSVSLTSECPEDPEDKFQAEDRYGFNRVDIAGSDAGSAALKKGIAELATDPKVLGELKNSDPAVADAIANANEEAAEEESRRFLRKHPEYRSGDSNLESLTLVMAHNFLNWTDQEVEERDPAEAEAELIARGYWSAEHLESAWAALRSHGLGETRKGTIKQTKRGRTARRNSIGLTWDDNRDENQVLQAVLRYVSYATGYDPDEIEDQFNSPSPRSVIDKAQVFVFEQCAPNYTITSEHRRYIREFIGGRPVSFPLLFEAWKQCQQEEQRGFTRSLIPSHEASPSLNFDDLDDTQIDSLYHNTMRHIAKTSPSAPGILQ